MHIRSPLPLLELDAVLSNIHFRSISTRFCPWLPSSLAVASPSTQRPVLILFSKSVFVGVLACLVTWDDFHGNRHMSCHVKDMSNVSKLVTWAWRTQPSIGLLSHWIDTEDVNGDNGRQPLVDNWQESLGVTICLGPSGPSTWAVDIASYTDVKKSSLRLDVLWEFSITNLWIEEMFLRTTSI